MQAHVFVWLKPGVLDPQGEAVKNALHSLGHHDVLRMRIGKVFDIDIDVDDVKLAEASAGRMAQDLLANPVMENFSVEVLAATESKESA